MIRANLTGTVYPVGDLVIWLIPTDNDMVSVILHWGAVTGAQEYKIYKSTTSPISGYALLDSTTNTQWIDSDAVIDYGISFYYVTVDNTLESQVIGSRGDDVSIGSAARGQVSTSVNDWNRNRGSLRPEISRVTAEDSRVQSGEGGRIGGK
jgi:hypothetical protein